MYKPPERSVDELIESLETRAAIRRRIPRPEPDRISTDLEAAAKHIRSLHNQLLLIHQITQCIAECPPITAEDTATVRNVKNMAQFINSKWGETHG